MVVKENLSFDLVGLYRPFKRQAFSTGGGKDSKDGHAKRTTYF